MSENELVKVEPETRLAPSHSYLTNPAKFEHIWRVATCFSRSSLVPQALRGKPEDCFILTQLAMRLDVDPFMLMQNTYVVHGRPGMEAKLQIGLLNSSGRISGNVEYIFDGANDAYGCTAVVTDAATGQTIRGPKVDLKMVKAERWDSKEGSKWKTMPAMMFRYRAASMLIRAHYPEVTLGLLSKEELEDMVIDVEHAMTKVVSGGGSKSQALADAINNQKAQEETKEGEKQEQPAKGRKKKKEPPQAEQPPAEEEADDPQTWFEIQLRRITQCHSILELMPLVGEITNDPMKESLSDDQQQQLAEAAVAAQNRLE